MTRIGLILLDTLTNVFLKVLFIVKFRMCEHIATCFKREIVMAELSE